MHSQQPPGQGRAFPPRRPAGRLGRVRVEERGEAGDQGEAGEQDRHGELPAERREQDPAREVGEEERDRARHADPRIGEAGIPPGGGEGQVVDGGHQRRGGDRVQHGQHRERGPAEPGGRGHGGIGRRDAKLKRHDQPPRPEPPVDQPHQRRRGDDPRGDGSASSRPITPASSPSVASQTGRNGMAIADLGEDDGVEQRQAQRAGEAGTGKGAVGRRCRKRPLNHFCQS